jgi:sugar (pentulose or hexulose) kinase
VFADARRAAQAGVKVIDEVEPDPEWVARYTEQRERFEALYPFLARLPPA